MTETSLDSWWQEDETQTSEPIQVLHYVTAVVVSRNGAGWLPTTLRALQGQTRSVDQLIAADVASEDSSVELFQNANATFIAHLPEGATQSDALNAALSQVESAEKFVHWVWILHDDSAPKKNALEELLNAANQYPQAAVIGCKVIDWEDENHVLDVGSSITAIGTRYSELEQGELDQGQHDTMKPILAVSHAGMLVRLDMWRQLGGFSPELPHFRNDTEFCWRVWETGSEVVIAPQAEISHVAATVRDVRKNPVKGSVHYLDRRAGLTLLFSRTAKKWLWLRMLLTIVAGGFRALGYLLIQDILAARDEIRATLSAILNRSRVKNLRTASGGVPLPRGLRPTVAEQFIHSLSEAFNGVLTWWNQVLEVLFPKRLHVSDVGLLQAFTAVLLRPGSLLALVTISIGVFVTRAAFVGEQVVSRYTGVVYSSRDLLLNEYFASWHAVGFGSELPANPFLLFLWFISRITFIQPDSLIVWISTLGPWLSALSLHLALRSVIAHSQTRMWLAGLYGLSPMVLAAAGMGNIAVVIFAITFPAFVRVLLKVEGSWRFAAIASLLLSLMMGILPILWLITLLSIIAISLTTLKENWPKWMFVFGASFVLTLPWSSWTLINPNRWFDEFGAESTTIANAWSALFHSSSGFFIGLLSCFLVLLAALSLLDTRNSAQGIRAWKVIAITLSILLAGQALATVLVEPSYFSSLEVGSLIVFAGLLYCLASTSAALRVQLTRSNFGWRQVGTALSVLMLTLLPFSNVINQGLLEDRSEGLRRQPAITSTTLLGFSPDERLRTLYLETQSDGELQAQILDGRPMSIGDRAVIETSDVEDIQATITQWLSGYAATEANPLIDLGIGFVALPVRDSAISTVSSKGNLERLLTTRNAGLLNVWRVSDVESRAWVVEASGEKTLLKSISKAPMSPEVTGVILPSEGARLLVLADRRSENWIATLNGEILTLNDSASLSWTIPPNQSGEISIQYSDGTRTAWLILSGIALLIVILMIAPRRRNTYRDEWLEE